MNIWLVYQLLEKNGVSILHNASKTTTSDGTIRYTLLKVQDLGNFFKIANPSDFFRKLARAEKEDKFIEFVKQPTGRPAMYIAEPLFYEFLLTSNNEICQLFQKWVFGKVMNHIVNDGLYTRAMED